MPGITTWCPDDSQPPNISIYANHVTSESPSARGVTGSEPNDYRLHWQGATVDAISDIVKGFEFQWRSSTLSRLLGPQGDVAKLLGWLSACYLIALQRSSDDAESEEQTFARFTSTILVEGVTAPNAPYPAEAVEGVRALSRWLEVMISTGRAPRAGPQIRANGLYLQEQ